MRIRINNQLQSEIAKLGKSRGVESNLYTIFRPYFDFLLSPTDPAIDLGESVDCYVHNKAVEEFLSEVLASPHSSLYYMVGLTGVGKTTYIRYTFGGHANPYVQDNLLVIPFYLQSAKLDEELVPKRVRGKIAFAIDVLCRHFELKATETELGEFILSHRGDLLYGDESLPYDATLDVRVANFRKTDPYAFYAETLKHFLYQSTVTKVLIVLDDLESSEYEDQREIIRHILRFQSCMMDGPEGISRQFSVDVLVTCRPLSNRLFARDSILASNTPRNRFFVNPVRLLDIATVRFETAVRELGEGRLGSTGVLRQANNMDSWKKSKEHLDNILSTVALKYGEQLVELANNNMREAFTELVEILVNSHWFQTTGRIGGAFTVEPQAFNPTDAGVMRAMALRSGTVFDGESSLMRNLLYNAASVESDLILLHISKYFLFHENFEDSDRQMVSQEKFINRFESAFGDGDTTHHLHDLLQFAVKNEFLEKDDVDENGEKKRYLAALPRLAACWKALADTSVYLELCRDDTFITILNAKAGRRRPTETSKLSDTRLFHALFDFWQEIVDRELGILQSIRKDEERLANYRKFFAPESIAEQVLHGIDNSLYKYYGQPQGKPPEVPHELKKRLSEARTDVKQVESILKV